MLIRSSTTATGVQIVIDGTSITVPLVAAAAVEALLMQSPITVGELPGLDADSRLVLVQRLIREGVLRVS